MVDDVSVPGRLAGPDEGISDEELGLAARNHGMPLEALRYDLTPPGLHYLLIHYDIPAGIEQDYQRSLTVDEALGEDVLLAYAMNGAPLPPQHGYPVRLVVPGWYGMAHVKWLVGIELVAEPFTGFQQAVAYRMRQDADEPGEPVARIAPRALIVPPGFPDFMSRTRIVRPGPVPLQGRAWSGRASVVRVEVSPDAGRTWADARLDPDGGHRWAWRRFTHEWTATPGRHVLTARASTADGETQPVSQAWNRGGFANNATHDIAVVCIP